MKELSKQELLKTEGGSLSVGAILAITGGVIFLIGVIDGYTRPLKCN
ncbi:MAG: hypothetical protein PHN72_02730 [Bacilli bacterium]|nr:hypothetical protein [Bacilli bacterium]